MRQSICFIQPYRVTENGLELSAASSSFQTHRRAGKREVGTKTTEKKKVLSQKVKMHHIKIMAHPKFSMQYWVISLTKFVKMTAKELY